ncbi:hypothetical protein P5G61_26840 [Paenibacillus sp. F6_3S_P_1C]|uniref:Uncharacterized protein n=1 Tax=Paenibacillus vandeheii TaxID=3035917 RepID=A0ABT8JIJ3_9BACL|nr:hypothetical protein [Paenibacillus vandeheii]MDN4604872.1 hypothetical protein [Paenibacillus vandeheii]
MGMSSFVLFRHGDSNTANNLFNTINNICTKEKLFFDNDEKTYNSEGALKYTRIYISDTPFKENYSRTLSFSVYDEPYEFQTVTYEWDDTQNEYFKAVVSDDFDDNADLLFQFLFAFLSEFSDARVWIEEDWFYTLEDMKKIKSSYNDNWCYIDPKDL